MVLYRCNIEQFRRHDTKTKVRIARVLSNYHEYHRSCGTDPLEFQVGHTVLMNQHPKGALIAHLFSLVVKRETMEWKNHPRGPRLGPVKKRVFSRSREGDSDDDVRIEKA